MPRLRRIDYPGAWHHVMNRGIDNAATFVDEVDRQRFLDILADATDRTALECHAYCLMGNHIHLLLQSRSGELSDGMQWLNARYAESFNRRHGRDGPLFRGRFRSVLIGGDAQLFNTQNYIHQNPVAAGLCRSAHLWPWSSAQFYVGDVMAPGWLATGVISQMTCSGSDPSLGV